MAVTLYMPLASGTNGLASILSSAATTNFSLGGTTVRLFCSSLRLQRSSVSTTGWWFTGTWIIQSYNGSYSTYNGSHYISSITFYNYSNSTTVGTYTSRNGNGIEMNNSITFGTTECNGNTNGFIYLEFHLSDGSSQSQQIYVYKDQTISTIVFHREGYSGYQTYIAYQGSDYYFGITFNTGYGFGEAYAKWKLTFNSTQYINITEGSDYYNVINDGSSINWSDIRFANTVSGYGDKTLSGTVYIYNRYQNSPTLSTPYSSVNFSIQLYGQTRNASISCSLTPTTFSKDTKTKITISGTYVSGSGTGNKAELVGIYLTFPTSSGNGSTLPTSSNVIVYNGNTVVTSNSRFLLDKVGITSDGSFNFTNGTIGNNLYITNNFGPFSNSAAQSSPVQLMICLYNSSGTLIYTNPPIIITLAGGVSVLTSIKTNYFSSIPSNIANKHTSTITKHIEDAWVYSGTLSSTTYLSYPVGKASSNATTSSSYNLKASSSSSTAVVYYAWENDVVSNVQNIQNVQIIIRAVKQSNNTGSGVNTAKICIDCSDVDMYEFNLDSTSSKIYTINISGSEIGSNPEVGIKFTVGGSYGGYIQGVDIIYTYFDSTSDKIKGLVEYMDPGNSCGTQKTQVWPPIYDVTVNALNSTLNVIDNNTRYLSTTYSYNTSSITNQQSCQTILGPINYSAESPKGTLPYTIQADSGSATVDYRIGVNSFSELDSTYAGTYITCYVSGRAYANYKDSTHFCRLRFCSWYDDDIIGGSTTYITNTTFQVHTLLNHYWISASDWNDYYRVHRGGLYVELLVGQAGGGALNGISTYIEFIKKVSKINFPLTYNRYGGPIINEVNNLGYTYLRSGAIQLIYSSSDFQATNPALNNVSFYTTSYSIKSNTVNTNNAISYNGSLDSYTLILKTVTNYSGEFKIPYNGYTYYNATTSTISPSSFGYYLCGYFVLPDTYTFGGGADNKQTNTARNYTGKNLVDFDTSTYISRYRFTGFSGLKGWTTKRTPTEFTAKFNGTSDTDYVTISTGNSNFRIAFVFVSTSSTINLHEYGYGIANFNSGTGDFNSSSFGGNYDWSIGGYPAPYYYLTGGSSLSSYNLKNLTGVSVGSNSSGSIKITFDLSSSSPSFLQKIVAGGTQINCAIHDSWADDQGWELGADPWYTSSSLDKTYSYEHSSVQLYVYVMYYYNSDKMGYWGFEKNSSLYSIKWVPTKWNYEVVYTS